MFCHVVIMLDYYDVNELTYNMVTKVAGDRILVQNINRFSQCSLAVL